MGCVHKHTRLTTLSNIDPYIELQPITDATPETSDQVSPQHVQEILKVSDIDMSKFQHYKRCEALCQTTTQSTELSEV